MYFRNGVRLLFLFSFLYFSSIQRVDADKNQTRSTSEDEAIMRTLAKIQSQSEAGRLVVLFCRIRCLKERGQVSKWVREFNDGRNLSTDQRLDFHFHAYKKPVLIAAVDERLNSSSLGAFYFVADQGFPYEEELDDRKAFLNWLSRYEQPLIQRPTDHTELNEVLNKDLQHCADALLENIARSFTNDNEVNVVELRRPLSTETEALLTSRLPGLSDSCRMLILLYRNAFYEVEKNIMPSKLYVSLKEWRGGECNEHDQYAIRPELTPLQLQYHAEERQIRKIQENQTYVVVGAIGGLAVIALAISIFWGLQSA
ncbi:putative potassium channel regulatory protein sup-10 [Aphelenchoides fujianensis]|nr:putative potassium channel regulatory protein sup-10 [Aphelenchoides fujianensis]